MIANDGSAWSSARAHIKPTFSRSTIADTALFAPHIARMFSDIDTHGGAPFDLQPLVRALAHSISAELLLGRAGSAAEDAQFGAAVDAGVVHAQFANLFGSLWWLWRPRAYRDARSAMRGYVERMLSGDADTPFMRAMAADGCSHEQIVNEVLQALFAGRDTTSTVLGWAVWSLVRNRDALARLAADVRALGDGELTVKQLDGCQYLKAVINESKNPGGLGGGDADIGLHSAADVDSRCSHTSGGTEYDGAAARRRRRRARARTAGQGRVRDDGLLFAAPPQGPVGRRRGPVFAREVAGAGRCRARARQKVRVSAVWRGAKGLLGE